MGGDTVQSTRSLPTFRYRKRTDILWKIILNVVVKWVLLIFRIWRVTNSNLSLDVVSYFSSVPPDNSLDNLSNPIHYSLPILQFDDVQSGLVITFCRLTTLSIDTLYKVDRMARWIRKDLKGRGRVTQLMFRHLFGGSVGRHGKPRPE